MTLNSPFLFMKIKKAHNNVFGFVTYESFVNIKFTNFKSRNRTFYRIKHRKIFIIKIIMFKSIDSKLINDFTYIKNTILK